MDGCWAYTPHLLGVKQAMLDIYIYAFSRCFYPKRLIQVIHLYCQYMCFLGIEPTTFALLTQCSTTEPQEQTCQIYTHNAYEQMIFTLFNQTIHLCIMQKYLSTKCIRDLLKVCLRVNQTNQLWGRVIINT